MTDSVESVLQKSREEFEKWSLSVGAKPDDPMADFCWQIWQASRSALEPMVAELTESRTRGWAEVERLQSAYRWFTNEIGKLVYDGWDAGKDHGQIIARTKAICERAEAAEQALREAQATTCRNYYRAEVPIEQNKTLKAANENLRDLLGEAVGWVALHQSPSALDLREAIDEALSPFPTPAQPCLHECGFADVHTTCVCVTCGATRERGTALPWEAKPSPESPTPAPDTNTQSLCCAKPSPDSATPQPADDDNSHSWCTCTGSAGVRPGSDSVENRAESSNRPQERGISAEQENEK